MRQRLLPRKADGCGPQESGSRPRKDRPVLAHTASSAIRPATPSATPAKALLALVLCLSATPKLSMGASPSFGEPTPVFLTLDGIEFGPTVDGVVSTGLVEVRTENYLGPALENAWGDTLDFDTVPWGGRLRGDGDLANYLSLAKAKLCYAVEHAAGRPVVVIAHSWGSVVGYQAINGLQAGGCPSGSPLPPGSVDLFVSMGSPLGSDFMERTIKALPGTVPGQELIGKPIAKPATVKTWVNVSVNNDLIAATISAADRNLRWDAGANAVLRPAPLAYTYAHSAYYERQDLVDKLAETIKGALEADISKRIAITAPDVAENGAVIPVTVGIAGETIREIALYSGDLSRLAIKAALNPLASPWIGTRVRLRETGDLIVTATTDDGRQLTARKKVSVTGGAYPKDGPATDPGIKLLGKGDTVKMLMSSPMGATSHIASLRVTTGGQPLVDAQTTPWLATNPYFAFKSAQDVGGRFEVEVGLNSGERFAAQTDQGLPTNPVVSVPRPPTSPPVVESPPQPIADTGSARIELKDGNVLVGRIAAKKVNFASSFGTVEVDLGEVQSFTEGALRLADGTVLKGRFSEGTIAIATSRGELTTPTQDVVSIALGGGSPVKAAAVVPQPGQGVLTGRVLDNFEKPVADATVRILGSSLEARTDSDGRYRLNYAPGQLQVAIQAPGHDPIQFALALSAPTEYPLEDKVLLRLPPGSGVFYWDTNGWTALQQCNLKSGQNIDRGDIDFMGERKETYKVTGTPTKLPARPSLMFLDNTEVLQMPIIHRIQRNGEIVTAIQHGGIVGMMEDSRTSGVKYTKSQMFPGQHVLFGNFDAGPYAIVDGSEKNACFTFQVGPDQLRAEDAVEPKPGQSPDALGGWQDRELLAGVIRIEEGGVLPNGEQGVPQHLQIGLHGSALSLDRERRSRQGDRDG